jgi:hypothetical protein
MHRRSALQLNAATVAASLAGCSVPTAGDAAGVTLERVTVRNYLDEAVSVSLLLVADETVVRWTTLAVPGPPDPFAALEDLPPRHDRTSCTHRYPRPTATDPFAPTWWRTRATSPVSR